MKTVEENPVAENHRWHPRLHKAVILNQCDVADPETRRADACAFGKWLMELEDAGHHHVRATELHGRFHLAAAHILDIAQSGRKREALELLSAEGEYAGIYSELMLEMEGWKKQQFPWYGPRPL